MAHNALIRGGPGSGNWTNVVVTAGDWETFDQRQFESINGDLGGTWAPAAVIIIGGAGMSITGPLAVSGLAALTGGVVISTAALLVTSAATISGTLDLQGAITVEANMTVTGATHQLSVAASAPTPLLASGLNVTAGATTLQGGLLVTTGTVTLDSQVNVNAGFKFTSTSTPLVETKLKINAGGHIAKRRVDGSASDHTYAIADADIVIVQAGVLGAATVIYTMSNTGCTGGETIEIMNNDGTTNNLIIRQHNGATTITTLRLSLGFVGVKLVNNGSGSASAAWEVAGYSHIT